MLINFERSKEKVIDILRGKVSTVTAVRVVTAMEAEAVDAVEVVRCKDCKHFGGHGACHCHAADKNGTPIFVREDDFCSYGERKTE